MIDRLTQFTSEIDLPMAIISVILGVVLKMAWDVTAAGLQRRRQAFRDNLAWYRELRTLARKIAFSHAVTKTYTDKFDIDIDGDDVEVGDVGSEEPIPDEAAEHLHDLLEGHREAAHSKHRAEMEVLYEELLSHVATADIELDDELTEEIETLLFHAFMGSLLKFDVPEDYQMPAEERAETIVEMCDGKIEELEAELPVWRGGLSRLGESIPSKSLFGG